MPKKRKKESEARARPRPTLGLVMGHIGDPFTGPLWSGACDAAEELDANLICFTTGRTDLRETTGSRSDPVLDLIDTLLQGKLDGLIFVPTSYTFLGTRPQIFQALCDRSASLPKISIGASPVDMPTVRINNKVVPLKHQLSRSPIHSGGPNIFAF